VEVTCVADQDAIDIAVADTGPGIPPEFLPELFDRFTQHDRSRTRRHGGLGLGLSIARHIVELHGGTIAAANRPEGGACFRIHVPVTVDGTGVALASPHVDTSGLGGLIGALRGTRVLVIDDDSSAREITAAILERCGANVRTAGSAQHGARALLEGVVADLLVVDLAMPDVDGYAFLVRARALFPRVLALALTAHAAPAEELRARAAGFDGFLSKPVTPALLARVVADLVARDGRTGGNG
jgi:CheY-like chemotaxis protein